MTSVYVPPVVSDDEDPPKPQGSSIHTSPNDSDQNKLTESMNSKLTLTEQELSQSLPGKLLPIEGDRSQNSGSSNNLNAGQLYFADNVGGMNSPSAQDQTSTSNVHSKSSMNNNNSVNISNPSDQKSGSQPSPPSQLSQENNKNDQLTNNQTEINPQHINKKERVLVEINGKFELVSVSDLQAMGYALPMADDEDVKDDLPGAVLKAE